MEADQETTTAVVGSETTTTAVGHKHASSTATPSPTVSESRQRSSSNPQDGTPKHSTEHDSLVTVRLSEPPRQLTLNTTNLSLNGSLANRRNAFANNNKLSPGVASPGGLHSPLNPDEGMSPVVAGIPASNGHGLNLQDELDGADDDIQDDDSKTISGPEVEESDEEEVDWDQLQKTEEAESKDNEEDTAAMLLARLEQENDRLATNPKTFKVKVVDKLQQSTRKPRPPSMAQLREMVQGPTPPPLRYSMLPPPPMTDLEFYAALVKDYQQTAARLPTLLANKIRKGIPPPLRGVVWQSMSGARDSALEDEFDRLTGESSPYEGLIGKDLGRSFASVEMFRDPEGEGQRMLGRVLKCFSLYDPKIGYCQGLALLVGPLLIHGLGDKQAFCVLVKLMEHYDLRASFTPDLHGLHVKIYQFRSLLRDNLPVLSGHLDELQVDPAFVSQWFLSFFAVTLPLPFLYRLYDVIFAEGASETIMRVALSVMRKNEARILAYTEMEDVLQLLLSRALWDCYHYNADEFVSDFVSVSNVVTRERLSVLEQGYRESQLANPPTSSASATSANAARASEVTNIASRFLGRLWANSTTSLRTINSSSSPSTNLAPSAASRPLSMLKRSASKQSLASTLNSMDASSTSTSSAASVLSSASTDATSISRDSAADDSSTLGRDSRKLAAQGSNADSQIEDLLIALSDLQRQQALLADQLQREREEREEDRKAVRTLLDGVRAGESVPELLDALEGRFGEDDNRRRSSITQTKPQMRDDLARTKEQLQIEISKTQDANRRAVDLEQEIANMKDQLRESHTHVRTLHTEKQRLEKQIHGMRVRASDSNNNDNGNGGIAGGWLSRNPSTRSAPGLRELRLGKSQSTPSQITKRTSSLLSTNAPEVPPPAPAPTSAPDPAASSNENEALLLELVQAKTSEAVARQEAEEAKQKLEKLRKDAMAAEAIAKLEIEEVKQKLQQLQKQIPAAAAAASAAADQTQANSPSGQAGQAGQGVMGMFRSFTTAADTAASAKPATPATPTPAPAPTPAATPAAASGGGGFWGWRK